MIKTDFSYNFEGIIKGVDETNVFKRGECDVIVGGPPCQGFSMAGARIRSGFIDDPRNYLFKHYFNVVKKIHPKAFVIENVPGLVALFNGEVKDNIISRFAEMGYEVKYKIC